MKDKITLMQEAVNVELIVTFGQVRKVLEQNPEINLNNISLHFYKNQKENKLFVCGRAKVSGTIFGSATPIEQ